MIHGRSRVRKMLYQYSAATLIHSGAITQRPVDASFDCRKESHQRHPDEFYDSDGSYHGASKTLINVSIRIVRLNWRCENHNIAPTLNTRCPRWTHRVYLRLSQRGYGKCYKLGQPMGGPRPWAQMRHWKKTLHDQ